MKIHFVSKAFWILAVLNLSTLWILTRLSCGRILPQVSYQTCVGGAIRCVYIAITPESLFHALREIHEVPRLPETIRPRARIYPMRMAALPLQIITQLTEV